jgi:hypothetical protein
MPDLTVAYEENGYKYVETSPELKQAASALPCFAALHWPDYSTEVIEDTINGKPVVIQLWKGWCQQFLSSPSFPGGVGAEVGIYERVTGKGFPSAKPDSIPDAMWNVMRALSKRANGDFWWPVAELNEIECDFINPVTNTKVFHAGPQKTYWLTKWMDTDSYDEYQKSQGKKWSWLPAWFPKNSRTPTLAANYTLEYKINGKTYPRW